MIKVICVFPNNNLLYAMNGESIIFGCRWGLRKITSGLKGVCYFVGDTLTRTFRTLLVNGDKMSLT